MTEQALTADVTADVNDEQVDKFFESGGEEAVETSESSKDARSDGEKQTRETQQAEQKQDRYVPHEALHEERMRRKEIQQEMHEIRQRNSSLEQNFQRLIERINQANQPQAPSFEEDPIGNLRVQNERIAQHLLQQHQVEQERARQDHFLTQQQNFIGRYQSDAQEFSKSTADFKEAYQFMVQSKLREYHEAGYSPQQANQLLAEDEMAVAAKAYKDGVNPAERIYRLAKSRGYQGSSQSNEKKLDTLEKGIKASKSLSGVGGKSNDGPMTLDQVAHLSDDELDDFISNPKQWSKFISSHS